MPRNPNRDPHYMNEEEFEDLYKLKEREKERLKDRTSFDSFEDEIDERKIIERKIRAKVAMPRMELDTIKPLQRISPQIIGNLFDRVKFLEDRINEINDILKIREDLHNDMIKEIDVDIKEKEEMASRVADIDEKRNFQLDISILRKEKRHEGVQFWKDITELKSELRELTEKHEAETKITNLFEDLKDDVGGEVE